MSKVKRSFILLLMVSIFLAACSTSGQAGLSSSSWKLVTLNRTDIDPSLPAITISFDGKGQVSGSAGCNSYGGSYTASEGTIAFSQIVSTLMACQDETVMANEMAFLQTLNGINHYMIQGDSLTLSDGDQELVFARQ